MSNAYIIHSQPSPALSAKLAIFRLSSGIPFTPPIYLKYNPRHSIESFGRSLRRQLWKATVTGQQNEFPPRMIR